MDRKKKGKRKNILLLLSDQHRYDFLGINSALPLRTPVLDGLARHGVRFTKAICPSPLCAPSRACLASGKRYAHCGVPDSDTDYPISQPTYYTSLRDSGYHVAGVGKFDLHKATSDWGLDGSRLLKEWGFSDGIDNEGKHDAINSGSKTPKGPYMAYLHEKELAEMHVNDFGRRHPFASTFPTPLPDGAYCDNWIAANGLKLLEGFSKEKPWHLVVNFTGPHDPMDVTAAMHRSWQGVEFPGPHANSTDTEFNHQAIRQNYAAMIENIDGHIANYLKLLETRGEFENTVVIYSSDHGEMLGDHGLWGKQTWRHPSLGVPMIVSGPDVLQGLVSESVVSLHDLAATFIDYAGSNALPDMDSKSLRGVLEGGEVAHRDLVTSGLDDGRVVYDGRYKLVVTEGRPALLFDLLDDPHEEVNIATDRQEICKRLSAELE